MRRLLIAAVAVLSLGAFANVVNLSYTFTDFQTNLQLVSRATLTPIAPFADYNGALLVANPTSQSTGTNGSVTYSNIIAGYAYRIQLDTIFGSTIRTSGIPATATGNVNGRDYFGNIVGVQGGVVTAFYYLYGNIMALQSGGATNSQVLVFNGTNWVAQNLSASSGSPFVGWNAGAGTNNALWGTGGNWPSINDPLNDPHLFFIGKTLGGQSGSIDLSPAGWTFVPSGVTIANNGTIFGNLAGASNAISSGFATTSTNLISGALSTNLNIYGTGAPAIVTRGGILDSNSATGYQVVGTNGTVTATNLVGAHIGNGSGITNLSYSSGSFPKVIDVTLPPFNADPTGAADSSGAIQYAVNFWGTNGNKGSVYLPGGVYKLNSVVTIPSNLFVPGSGNDGNYTNHFYFGNNDSQVMIDCRANASVLAGGPAIKYQSNGTTNLVYSHFTGLHFLGPGNVNLDDSSITLANCVGQGMFMGIPGANAGTTGGSQAIFRNCQFSGFSYGLVFSNWVIADVALCDFQQNTGGGIILAHSDNNIINNCTFILIGATSQLTNSDIWIVGTKTDGTDSGNNTQVIDCSFDGRALYINGNQSSGNLVWIGGAVENPDLAASEAFLITNNPVCTFQGVKADFASGPAHTNDWHFISTTTSAGLGNNTVIINPTIGIDSTRSNRVFVVDNSLSYFSPPKVIQVGAGQDNENAVGVVNCVFNTNTYLTVPNLDRLQLRNGYATAVGANADSANLGGQYINSANTAKAWSVNGYSYTNGLNWNNTIYNPEVGVMEYLAQNGSQVLRVGKAAGYAAQDLSEIDFYAATIGGTISANSPYAKVIGGTGFSIPLGQSLYFGGSGNTSLFGDAGTGNVTWNQQDGTQFRIIVTPINSGSPSMFALTTTQTSPKTNLFQIEDSAHVPRIYATTNYAWGVNSRIIQSNSYPVFSWASLGNCGCIDWISNTTYYMICTNSISQKGSTNQIFTMAQ